MFLRNRLSAVFLALIWLLPVSTQVVRADDPVPKPPEEEKKEEPKKPDPDPTGASIGDKGGIDGYKPVGGAKLPRITVDKDKPDKNHEAINAGHDQIEKVSDSLDTIADYTAKNRVFINMAWTLLTGFLVMFMQAGFAMVETGLTRSKNVTHTMAMNIMIYAIGILSFWAVGFAFMMGKLGPVANLGGNDMLSKAFSIHIGGKEFVLAGADGFFLAGRAFDAAMMTMFLFQMVFMDTAATIPTGAMAERWKFLAFVLYGVWMCTIVYPIYGCWVWGNGWLSQLGANYGLGHGHIDFAGSSVVHMTGGVASLVGVWVLGARIGKFNKDGSANVLPAHSVPMYMVGTFVLAFGWFGFNPGSTWGASDLSIGRIATNTMLASASGAMLSMIYMWCVYKKPDPSFMCNGLLAGLVAITAPCAYVAPWAAVLIGAVAGVLVVWSCLFFEKVVKVDDPVGAISVHGVNGMWGVLAIGLFADGTYNAAYNNSYWYEVGGGKLKWFATKFDGAEKLPDGWTEKGVTGLFYGNTSQLLAQCIGVAANIVWVGVTMYIFFKVCNLLIGNRVSAAVEIAGLDVPELGILGYINEDPGTPEGHLQHGSSEPRPALVPPNGKKGFTVVVEGISGDSLKELWSKLCLPGEGKPTNEFRAVYPFMTTCQGTRFRFRGGDSEVVRTALEKLIQANAKGQAIRTRLEGDVSQAKTPALI